MEIDYSYNQSSTTSFTITFNSWDTSQPGEITYPKRLKYYWCEFINWQEVYCGLHYCVKFDSHSSEPANYMGSYTYEYRVTSVIFSTGLLTQIKLLYYRKLVK